MDQFIREVLLHSCCQPGQRTCPVHLCWLRVELRHGVMHRLQAAELLLHDLYQVIRLERQSWAKKRFIPDVNIAHGGRGGVWKKENLGMGAACCRAASTSFLSLACVTAAVFSGMLGQLVPCRTSEAGMKMCWERWMQSPAELAKCYFASLQSEEGKNACHP